MKYLTQKIEAQVVNNSGVVSVCRALGDLEIVMSSLPGGAPGRLQDSELRGARATLAKPFRPDELVEKVRELVEAKKHHKG